MTPCTIIRIEGPATIKVCVRDDNHNGLHTFLDRAEYEVLKLASASPVSVNDTRVVDLVPGEPLVGPRALVRCARKRWLSRTRLAGGIYVHELTERGRTVLDNARLHAERS